jgi:hypothetical protein
MLGTTLRLIATSCLASACAAQQPPECTDQNWMTCETKPSLDDRSAAWPAQSAAFSMLADAAIAPDESWQQWQTFAAVNGASADGVILDSTGPFSAETMLELDQQFDTYSSPIESWMSSLNAAGPPPWSEDLASPATEAAITNQLDLVDPAFFEDAFGQPDPRSQMFGYLRATTEAFVIEHFGGTPPQVGAATQFVEDRISDWRQMQQTRLAGHDDVEIQAAIDELDAVDIRRITAVWATL